MCAIARPMSNGCLVARRAASAFVTGSVSRNSMSPKTIRVQANAPTVQRQAISAKVSEGQRKLARKPSSVGETRGINLSHHDIEQLAGDKYLFHDLLSRNCGFHLVIGKRALDDEIFGRVSGYYNEAAQLAVDLHGNFEFFFFGEGSVVLWPGLFEQVTLFAEHLPEFVSEVRSERGEQKEKAALHFGHERELDVVPFDRLSSYRVLNRLTS